MNHLVVRVLGLGCKNCVHCVVKQGVTSGHDAILEQQVDSDLRMDRVFEVLKELFVDGVTFPPCVDNVFND